MIREFLSRVVPNISDKIEYKIIESVNGKNVYNVKFANNKVVISGDNNVSIAMALNAYLKQVCKINWSWVGNRQININEIVKDFDEINFVVDQKYRVYLNYCTLNYSMTWWDFERWEKEIDFMAMNGINMPLIVVGTEAVWFKTLQEFGFSEKESLDYISAPTFWAWQLMTNIDSYLPPKDISYIENRLKLGKQILNRVLEFGMTPIQQGFSGHVPCEFKTKFPKAKIKFKFGWCDFPKTAQLDPLDALFEKFGFALLKNQEELFGKHHFYACDPFHEGTPPKPWNWYLKAVGKAIDKLYKNYDKDSTWVMQSWSIRKGIATSVPKDRLLILDLDSAKARQTNNFWGYEFVSGHLHNFGGKNSLHGNLKEVANNLYLEFKKEGANVVGTGLFMEGIEQNPIYYDLAFDVGIKSSVIDIYDWIKEYVERRVGGYNENIGKAYRLLLNSCYETGELHEEEAGSVICARPSIAPKMASPNDKIGLNYSNDLLIESLKLMLSCKEEFALSDGYQFDLCDLTRQVLSNMVVINQKSCTKYYEEKDVNGLMYLKCIQIGLMNDIDTLLSHRTELTLAKWINDSHKLATNSEELHYYDKCARLLITIWGDVNGDATLFDYAWREWSGLIKEYYIPRWESYFNHLIASIKTNDKVKDACGIFYFGRPRMLSNEFNKKLAEFELKWINTFSEYPQVNDSDVVPCVTELVKKYMTNLEKLENIEAD